MDENDFTTIFLQNNNLIFDDKQGNIIGFKDFIEDTFLN